MKSLICSLALILSMSILQAQTYTLPQSLNNVPNGIVNTNAIKGKIIITSWADTSAANAENYLKNYVGGLIYTTGDSSAWYRTPNKWVKILPSGSVTAPEAWLTQGNTISPFSPVIRLGTANAYELPIQTNGVRRLTVPVDGLKRTSDPLYKYVMIDTSGAEHYLAYGDGSSGGSTLTSIGSGYAVGVTGTNNVKSLTAGTGISLDSSVNGQLQIVNSSPGTLAWSLTTNAGTNPAVNGIGTTDSVDFVGKTNNTERFRWNARGALAVGSGTDYGTSGYVMKTNGSSTAPTWGVTDNIYNIDGTLAGDRTVTGNNKNLDILGVKRFGVTGINDDVYLESTTAGIQSDLGILGAIVQLQSLDNNTLKRSDILVSPDYIEIRPSMGELSIDTLNSQSNASDSMMVWTASGVNVGKVGYRAIPTSSGGTVTGTVSTNTIAKGIGGTAIGNSGLSDDGTNVTSSEHFIPSSNNTKDLGLTGTVWRSAYIGTSLNAPNIVSSTNLIQIAPNTLAGNKFNFTSSQFTSPVNVTVSAAGAASTSALSLTGTWFTGGTATTTKPQLLVEPTGTTSTAWSTSGTGLGVNAASGFTGNFLDAHINGGASLFYIGYAGQAYFANSLTASYFKNANNDWHIYGATTGTGSIKAMTLYNGSESGDVALQVGGTTTSYPAFVRNGTGIEIKLADNSAYTTLKASRITSTETVVLKGYTVATLPTGVQGMTAFCTDLLAPTFGATAVGGGAVVLPVFYDGTNWVVH